MKFPNGESVNYDCKNILLKDISKEDMISDRLFPYIPFYITRYENEICNKGNIDSALSDLLYFRTELTKLYQNNELSPEELLDIMNYINRIIKHIADGNEYEERMVSIMGGTVEETPSQNSKDWKMRKYTQSFFQMEQILNRSESLFPKKSFQMNDYWNCKISYTKIKFYKI